MLRCAIAVTYFGQDRWNRAPQSFSGRGRPRACLQCDLARAGIILAFAGLLGWLRLSPVHLDRVIHKLVNEFFLDGRYFQIRQGLVRVGAIKGGVV